MGLYLLVLSIVIGLKYIYNDCKIQKPIRLLGLIGFGEEVVYSKDKMNLELVVRESIINYILFLFFCSIGNV